MNSWPRGYKGDRKSRYVNYFNKTLVMWPVWNVKSGHIKANTSQLNITLIMTHNCGTKNYAFKSF